MDHKKIVYTSGRWFLPQKCKNGPQKHSIHFWEMGFSSKSQKNGPQKKVYTSGTWFFLKKCKNGQQKNSIHFSDPFFKTYFLHILSHPILPHFKKNILSYHFFFFLLCFLKKMQKEINMRDLLLRRATFKEATFKEWSVSQTWLLSRDPNGVTWRDPKGLTTQKNTMAESERLLQFGDLRFTGDF